MIKYKMLFFCMFLILSCNKNTDIIINLELVNTYTPNVQNGEKIFNKACITCHLYGTGGATLLTNTKEWDFLLKKKEKKEIYLNVLNGFVGKSGPMPAKGGCQNCSEQDLLDAIEYILSINKLTIIH